MRKPRLKRKYESNKVKSTVQYTHATCSDVSIKWGGIWGGQSGNKQWQVPPWPPLWLRLCECVNQWFHGKLCDKVISKVLNKYVSNLLALRVCVGDDSVTDTPHFKPAFVKIGNFQNVFAFMGCLFNFFFMCVFCFYFQMPICGENVCIGSVMVPTVCKPDEVRGKEELLSLATDFIDQYYTSIKR